MIHKLDNGKVVAIPDNDIDKLVDSLDCSIMEAIEIWLSDNEYTINEEQTALDEKAKETVKTSNIIKAQAAKPKTQRERVQKPDEEKEHFILVLAEALVADGAKVGIVDKRKIITFVCGDDEYKINLTRTRKPKRGVKIKYD